MRSRLALILYVPTLVLLLLLGLAYAGSAARATQQDVFLDRLRDTGYLSVLARQALIADDPTVVADDLDRYQEVYGVGAAVLARSGTTWVSNGLSAETLPEGRRALVGRRSDPQHGLVPWKVDELVVAEPVFEGGDVIGAVVTRSDVTHLSRGIWMNWGYLALIGIGLSLLAVVIADRTAGWVLRPVRRVERAMTEVGRGELAARIPESAGPAELRHVVAEFNQMAEHVQRSMHRQQEFVSNASHELRNPLNALMLRVEDLALSVPEEQAEEVASVRGEATRMAHILDALLLLADDTSPEVEGEPVKVIRLVTGRVESWQAMTSDQRVAVTKDSQPARAKVNRTVLESALDAVLDNAIKFSPDCSTVDVTVRERRDAGAGGGVEGEEDVDVVEAAKVVDVIVRDHGAGVPSDELERLTERFWRSPEHKRIRGTGLGLAIAAELLALGGGSLALSLPEGGGLQVTISVPGSERRDD